VKQPPHPEEPRSHVVTVATQLRRTRRSPGYGDAMDDKVNLAEKLLLLDKPFSPGIVGYLNDYKLQIGRVEGEFIWHKHDETDELFLVLRGHLTIQLRDRNIELDEGELYVVPRGVEHCPRADEETYILLIDPVGTSNTGDAGGELTAAEVEV